MRSFIKCKSCGGLGTITFPETDTLDGASYMKQSHKCLSCGGSGKFEIKEDRLLEYVERRDG